MAARKMSIYAYFGCHCFPFDVELRYTLYIIGVVLACCADAIQHFRIQYFKFFSLEVD